MPITAPLITNHDRQRLGTTLERAYRSGAASRNYLHALGVGTGWLD
jgi:hypothetical protein